MNSLHESIPIVVLLFGHACFGMRCPKPDAYALFESSYDVLLCRAYIWFTSMCLQVQLQSCLCQSNVSHLQV